MHVLQAQAARAFEQRRKAWDSEVNVLEQQRKALSKGGPQADDVVKQIACWQADMPPTEQAAVQLPKGVMSFPVLRTRAASKANGFADRGSAKKKAQEDRPQAELQKAQAKNPIQVSSKFICLVQAVYETPKRLSVGAENWLAYRLGNAGAFVGAQGNFGQAQMAAGRVQFSRTTR